MDEFPALILDRRVYLMFQLSSSIKKSLWRTAGSISNYNAIPRYIDILSVYASVISSICDMKSKRNH